MRCISLWQPWASLMAHGLKRLETRKASWAKPLAAAGPILIHAAKRWTFEQADLCHSGPFAAGLKLAGYPVNLDTRQAAFALPLGAIVGAVEVVAVIPTDQVQWMPGHERFFGIDAFSRTVTVGAWEKAFGDFTDGRCAVITRNPQAFRTPVPHVGRQSLFDVPEAAYAEALAFAVGQDHLDGRPV